MFKRQSSVRSLQSSAVVRRGNAVSKSKPKKKVIHLEVINSSRKRISQQDVKWWVNEICSELKAITPLQLISLTVVFLSPTKAQALNLKYRKKNYPTDVLSFADSPIPNQKDQARQAKKGKITGELVLCPKVVAEQAKEHNLDFDFEMGYLVLHGILHLLGFEHENSLAKARKMFAIQDRIFESLCQRKSRIHSR